MALCYEPPLLLWIDIVTLGIAVVIVGRKTVPERRSRAIRVARLKDVGDAANDVDPGIVPVQLAIHKEIQHSLLRDHARSEICDEERSHKFRERLLWLDADLIIIGGPEL